MTRADLAARASRPPVARCLPAALDYASRGWRVLPLAWIEDGRCSCWRGKDCQAAGKHPYRASGPDHGDATTIEFVIRRWWRDLPLANVAIIPGIGSGLVVLDIDPRNGGTESLADLERKHGPIPRTLTATTPSGGEHIYYKHPGREQIKTVHGFRPGLDLKADGGLVVAPPSVTLKGAYSWN